MASYGSYYTKKPTEKCCGTCAYWEGERKLEGSYVKIAGVSNLANCSKRHGNDHGLGCTNCRDWKARW